MLIKKIVANIEHERDEVILLVQWSGGHHIELRGQRTQRRSQLPSSKLKAVVETLRKLHTDGAIASA